MTFPFPRWFSRSDSAGKRCAVDAKEVVGAESQYRTAVQYETGDGMVQDYSEAVHWYALAADQNHAQAQYQLAMLYKHGQGVVRDEARWLVWVTRAANSGVAAAQYQLGVHEHLACRGLPNESILECRTEALKWVRLAAAQGYQSAENACEYVALGMTMEQVAESSRRVAAFAGG